MGYCDFELMQNLDFPKMFWPPQAIPIKSLAKC